MLLRHPADRLSIAYVLVHVGLMAWGAWPLAALSAVLAVGVTNIAHHHAHHVMWRHRLANRATDVVLSALMGIPIFVFPASHIRMHHRRITLGQDATHPSRFGSENHFVGLLAHPFRVLPAVMPDLIAFVRRRARGGLRGVLPLVLQMAAPIGLAVALAAIDPHWWWQSVLIPQLVGLHVLLAANYFQHARTEPTTSLAHSRSFVGGVNRVWFNIGYHTAHHEHPRAHWSELPTAHAELAARIPPELIKRSFIAYIWRDLIVAPIATSRRGR